MHHSEMNREVRRLIADGGRTSRRHPTDRRLGPRAEHVDRGDGVRGVAVGADRRIGVTTRHRIEVRAPDFLFAFDEQRDIHRRPAVRLPGKQRIDVNGKPYLLETPLRADFALVQAFLADYIGNLYYALTARNFNPVIAMAADTVIVEADNIVPVGVIAPDQVVTPAPVVDYIVSHA